MGVKVRVVLNVWCKKCGRGLCDLSHPRRVANIIDVEPCPDCIKNAIEEDRKKRYEDQPNFVKDYLER